MILRRLLLFTPAVLALLLGLLFWWRVQRPVLQAHRSALVGHEAPTVQLTPIADIPLLTNADLRSGQPVLVNFFASWCLPCRAEHPQLMALSRQHHLRLVGVAWKDTPAAAAKYLGELGNPYAKAGADYSGRSGINWGLAGVPESFIVDGKGKITAWHWGDIRSDQMESEIIPLLKQTKNVP